MSSNLASLIWAYNDEILSKRRKTYKASGDWPMTARHGKRLAIAMIPPVAKRLTKLELAKIRKVANP